MIKQKNPLHYLFNPSIHFGHRHIGPNEAEMQEMLRHIGLDSLDDLVTETIPEHLLLDRHLNLDQPMTEYDYLNLINKISKENKVYKSYIGLGYYGTITPSVILRNVFENPGWYTQYTPYQAEIAQGRLEALLNFQTMVSDLTGMEIANASLLDEGTAAAEAMAMLFAIKNKSKKKELVEHFLVADTCFPQTIEVVKNRAEPLGVKVVVDKVANFEQHLSKENNVFGLLLQFPNQKGVIEDHQSLVEKAHEAGAFVAVAADLLSLALLTPPGEWGADVVVGSTQRFGVPIGYGGPHAAYFATREKFKRFIPGRIIGVSVDKHENRALRMALQTREQHIRREKATSNICTAQALLANMAGFYAVYHGPKGIKRIAVRIHFFAQVLEKRLLELGFEQENDYYFDTLHFKVKPKIYKQIIKKAAQSNVNFRYIRKGEIGISIDETCNNEDINTIAKIFAEASKQYYAEFPISDEFDIDTYRFPKEYLRKSTYLEHPTFNSYHSETKMMRYLKSLENKDLSLMHSMIPLGSCTMKLNAATEMMPITWPEFSHIHPFAPTDQTMGYQRVFKELEHYLCVITGFAACSLQPNSGAQGEFAGLMVIRAYHQDRGDLHRNVVLIPSSAHGTNPASAIMSGGKVVVVKCEENGNINLADLTEKAATHSENLAALMITYPSTHGVFEGHVNEITKVIHEHGGLVYMDGANMNAQVGLTNPQKIGADVCHLNLHKTFSIPHGGGGPGMGPICCTAALAPFLPSHGYLKPEGETNKHIPAISAAPYGSASILLISYACIKMLGAQGLTDSTRFAILNANYIKKRLEESFEVLYTGEKNRVAHELILDLRPYNVGLNITVEDVAKRLMDYGFHAPTVSFPVAGTIMIEPTESEYKEEIDRFCEAMIAIKKEIDEIASGEADPENNVLKNAPHTLAEVTANEWNHPYSREKAAWPLEWVRTHKFWASVGRISNAYGDRNLICTCPSIESYA